jgi:hypothetical protein
MWIAGISADYVAARLLGEIRWLSLASVPTCTLNRHQIDILEDRWTSFSLALMQ